MKPRKPISHDEHVRRFWARVDKRGPDECWEWTGPSATAGYGRCYRLGGHLAHRAAYELTVGPIAPGAVICHRCDNPPCCNPAHLYAGTHGTNARDREERNRRRSLRGSDHPASRLTAAEVLSIRAAYAQGGITQQALADRFGVSLVAVHKIVRRQTWAWLTEEEAA